MRERERDYLHRRDGVGEKINTQFNSAMWSVKGTFDNMLKTEISTSAGYEDEQHTAKKFTAVASMQSHGIFGLVCKQKNVQCIINDPNI